MGNFSKNLFRKGRGGYKNRDLATIMAGTGVGKSRDPKLKGARNGNCNRGVCQQPGATFYSTFTNSYYCRDCARLINWANEDYAEKAFGRPDGVFAISNLPDGAIVAISERDVVTQWDAEAGHVYTAAETLKEFDVKNLTEEEKLRFIKRLPCSDL